MSGFKGRVKTDISRWCATKYATIPEVWCLYLKLFLKCSLNLEWVARHRDMSVFWSKLNPDTDGICGSPPGVMMADTLSFNAKIGVVDF